MAPKPVDGIIEAVRYAADGKIELVRLYERRGPTYSDRVLLTRAELVTRMKAGKRFAVGVRQFGMASTFVLGAPVSLGGAAGSEVILSGEAAGSRDLLKTAPLF